MDDIKPIKMYLISLLLLVIAIFGLYISIAAYRSYFLMGDMVCFSFIFASFILGWPLILHFAYVIFMCGYTMKKQNVSWSLSHYLGIAAMLGIVFSFLFSFYVAYNLTSQGYVTCHKKSIFSTTKYVTSKDMCE